MSRTILVTGEQVDAAPTPVAIKGGPDNVTPLIRKIAEAHPARGVSRILRAGNRDLHQPDTRAGAMG